MKVATMTYLLIVLIVCGLIHDGTCDECSNYTELQDLALRHPDNVYDSNTTALSDNIGFEEKWYRAGNLDMPNTRPDVNRCGTAWPFYLEDPVPQNPQIQENRACIGDKYDDCYFYNNIKVKNCGTYRVYKLKPIGFNSAAYCFSMCGNCNLAVSTSPTSTATTTTQGTQSPTTSRGMTRTTVRPTGASATTTTQGTQSPTTSGGMTRTTVRPTLPSTTNTTTTTTTTRTTTPITKQTPTTAPKRTGENGDIFKFVDPIESDTICLRPHEFVLYILSCFLLSAVIILTVWFVKKKGCQPPKEKSNMDEEKVYYTIDKKLTTAYNDDYDVIKK